MEDVLSRTSAIMRELLQLARGVCSGQSGGVIQRSSGGVYSVGTTMGPYYSATAAGTIPANALVKNDGSGVVAATANSLNVLGVNAEAVQKVSTNTVQVQCGYGCTVNAAAPLVAGTAIKAAASGKVCRHVDAGLAGATIKTAASGGNFSNQPANDGIEVVSSDAGDTTQTLTLIGTTNGGVTVVVETVTLNGTSQVSTVKTDWGVLLAAKLSGATAGTVTIREASGNLTITTLAPGTLTAGVQTVTAVDQGGHNVAPVVVAGGASTKVVGVQYMQNDGSTVAYQAATLNGTTDVTFGTAALLVTEVYNGDVATATSTTVKVGAEEDENRRIGKALTTAAAGATATALLLP